MSELETFRERLQSVFGAVLADPRVEVERSSIARLFVTVVTETFEGMEDHHRQSMAWQVLLDNFSDHDRRRIEFVFTETPAEVRQYVQVD